jgi:hypothetical protein
MFRARCLGAHQGFGVYMKLYDDGPVFPDWGTLEYIEDVSDLKMLEDTAGDFFERGMHTIGSYWSIEPGLSFNVSTTNLNFSSMLLRYLDLRLNKSWNNAY